MAAINGLSGSAAGLRRWFKVEPHELPPVAAAFAMFFSVLSAYYIIRPVRDEMGVELGKDALHQLFTVVFFVMLAAVPAFVAVASRVPRRYVLPAVYAFFAADLVLFWVLFRAGAAGPGLKAVFFIWASVFNLFVVSLFWSLMAELWTNTEAKRLYGLISAGGTAGALAGPVVTRGLISYFGTFDLLLVSAALLVAALLASLYLRRVHPAGGGSEAEPAGGGILDGAAKVLASPYLFRIAVFIFLANIVGTFFYLEQSRLVALEITDSAERVKFFAGRDLVVSLLTLTIEVLGTAQVLNRLGVGAALLALPVAATVSVAGLAAHPALTVVAAVMVAERVLAFSLAGPAIKVLYTLTPADEKYKVQNFVDTVVYRGGDAVSGWMFSILSGGAGFAAAAMPMLALPLAIGWLWVARQMGRAYEDRSALQSAPSAPVVAH
jgi:AAA family ATP:ADP antiporter